MFSIIRAISGVTGPSACHRSVGIAVAHVLARGIATWPHTKRIIRVETLLDRFEPLGRPCLCMNA
jgi:hypothetical protein